MQLPVLTFSAMLEQMAAGIQGAATQLLDLSLLEACAAVSLWLQWLILQVMTATRAATSQGPDLDSWMADFSFARLPGSAATGAVTFARYTTGMSATIPVGATVSTADGVTSFTVVADANNPAWTGSAFVIEPALSAITLPVAATLGGASGNVLAGSITVMATPIAGVDTVSNPAALSGGMDAESDAAFRARFRLYINSLSLATLSAIQLAVQSIQSITRYLVIENLDSQGNLRLGYFCVVADDGSGAPPMSLLSEVQTAVEAVRPIGSSFAVMGPQLTDANIAVAIETANTANHTTIAANVQAAIALWVAGLPIGGTLAISKIDAIAHDTDSSVISVTSTLINGVAADLMAQSNGVVVIQTISVN
jgi:uncharacterized phage protein gp47/JayE